MTYISKTVKVNYQLWKKAMALALKARGINSQSKAVEECLETFIEKYEKKDTVEELEEKGLVIHPPTENSTSRIDGVLAKLDDIKTRYFKR